MNYEELMQKWDENSQVSLKDFFQITKAISNAYPMIVFANLSTNTYTMIRDEEFLYNDIATSGCYDDLIDDRMENVHPNYQRLFYESFSREHLIRSFQRGKSEVYAEVYQKDKMGQYHWVSVHVIQIESESGDVMHICMSRTMDEVHDKREGEK